MRNMTTFKVGDTAVLKSGGPTMTVEAIVEHGAQISIWCVWFENKNVKRESFLAAVLELDRGPVVG
jgi:uncharacterized protein YodC (DUF2158 family)